MALEKSKFLDFFTANQEAIRAHSTLTGDTLIVERVKFPEKKVGSLFIADSKRVQSTGFTSETPEFFRVLLVGAGYYDDDTKADVPLEVRPGDIIHTGPVSVKLWSSFPFLEIADSDVLGITRYGEALWHWKSENEFVKFLSDFNRCVTAEVPRANGQS